VIVPTTSALARLARPARVTIVAPVERIAEVADIISGLPNARAFVPTADLPTILGGADIVVSAAGTSAWDICTLGIPAVLVAVVDNQTASLDQIVAEDLTLGLDIVRDGIGALEKLTRLVEGLIDSQSVRHDLAAASLVRFDGLGKKRVVDAMEGFGRR
jgi:spore coat polysaccharide biosynthesis predicted glycosyltransferase SpsG